MVGGRGGTEKQRHSSIAPSIFSLETGHLIINKEFSLEIFINHVRQLDQVNRCHDSLLDGALSLFSSQVSFNPSWTAHIDLYVLFDDLLVPGKNRSECVDEYLGSAVSVFGPALFFQTG